MLEKRLPAFTLAIYILAVTLGMFLGGFWATLGIGLSLVLFGSVWRLDGKMPLPRSELEKMAFAALGVMALLNFHSSDPRLSWMEWLKLGAIFIPLVLLSSRALPGHALHPKFFDVLAIAMIAGGLALSLELYLGGPLLKHFSKTDLLAKYNRGLSHAVILCFPVMAALWFSKKRWMIAPFFLLLLIPAGLTESRAAKLAMIAGLTVAIIAHFRPVLTQRLLAVGAAAVIAVPFAAREFFLTHYEALKHFPDSWHARIEIWDYISYRILERPLLGWGLGTTKTLDFHQPHGSQYIFTILPAGHPHNVMAQLWVELGLPGLALGLVFIVLTLRKAASLKPRLVPFALGAWAAAFCLSSIAFNFWTDSFFAAFAMTAFAFMLLEKKLAEEARPSRPSAAAPADRQ